MVGILGELIEHPRSGTGKPEPLKGYAERELWSRRIDQKHRLVYEIRDDELIVIAIAAYGHYGDNCFTLLSGLEQRILN
ncbi:MAG: Txe/YoeB family addiction module toxin [Rikenellaceae bacterium]